MRLPPILLIIAAGSVTLGISQTLAPTAHAQAIPNQTVPAVPTLRVSVQSLHLRQTLGGLEVTGRIINTGRQALTYPVVVCVFTDAAGMEVGHADGYLTAGPVEPGQSVGFRASAPKMPAFTAAALRLHEAGQTVMVQPTAHVIQSLAQADSRRTTVR